MRFREVNAREHGFSFDTHMNTFLQRHSFFSMLSRSIRKRATLDIETAAVAYDVKLDELTLWVNPVFMSKLTFAQVHGVLKHEFYHVVFRHLTERRRTPPIRWNIATDLAINWLIWHEAQGENNGKPIEDPDMFPLPDFALVPGRRPKPPADLKPSEQDAEAEALADAIERAPGNQTSEFYLDYLNAAVPPKKQSGDGDPSGMGDGGDGQPGPGKGTPGSREGERNRGSLDEHFVWDEIPPELREKVEGKIRAMVARAAQAADQSSSGWGSMPAAICEMVRKSVSCTVDWRALAQSFFGLAERGRTRRTVTQRDRKYGLLQPGVVTGHTAHLVVVVDQSGSVDDGMLAMFFAELERCTRKMNVTILPFDAACAVEDAWEWRKGDRPAQGRTKCGGTDFDAPTAVINQHARARGWEAAIFMTDGECSRPGSSVIPRAWVVAPGHKLLWDEDRDMVINMDSMPTTGAWR